MTKRKSNWHKSKRVTTAEFVRNRDVVRSRDEGCCVRCLYLFGLIVPGKCCDHYTAQAQGGDDKLSNLWLLCEDCHDDKTQRESNSLSGFTPIIGADGWAIEEPDWMQVIAERNRKREEQIGF